MRLAGVVLAGGNSSRFGRDKATEMFRGKTLIEWAIDTLEPFCEPIFVSGRNHGLYCALSDWPRPGAGPLGGLASALKAAQEHDCEQLLSLPCDCPMLPSDLIPRLLDSAAPAYIESCPVIGKWPVTLAQSVDEYLSDPAHNGGVRNWAQFIGAEEVGLGTKIWNINSPEELAELESINSSLPGIVKM